MLFKRLTLYVSTYIQNPKTWMLICSCSLILSFPLFCNARLGFIINQATGDWPLKNLSFIVINLYLYNIITYCSGEEYVQWSFWIFKRCIFHNYLCAPGEFLGRGFTRKIMLQAPEFKYLLAVDVTLFQPSFQSWHC